MFTRKMRKNLILSIVLIFGVMTALTANILLARVALAESCPANTTVSGTAVTFVGELTDMGGDQTTSVWFEYGQTISYGQKTSEKVLTQSGFYCITVSGLLPSTTYHYRAAARNSAGTSYGANKTFTTTSGPSVNLKANGSDGPISIPYNGSITLSWSSSNVNSCHVSGNWSGTKSTSGSQVIQNLTSSKVFAINCSGPGGSVSDSVTVNVDGQAVADFSIYKTVRNLSRGTAYSKSVYAEPGDVLTFALSIRTGNEPLYDLIVKDTLPLGLIYRSDLKVDNILSAGNIVTGLNIGNLAVGQEKTITFRADVASAESFKLGQTELTNTVLVSSSQTSLSDTAKVFVTKGAVAGAATQVPTGLTNNILFDSLILPLTFSLSIIWLFKSRIIKFEEWLDKRKKEYQVYKSKKVLQLKVAKIKAKEFFNKIR